MGSGKCQEIWVKLKRRVARLESLDDIARGLGTLSSWE
jgi:hypothetical protein